MLVVCCARWNGVQVMEARKGLTMDRDEECRLPRPRAQDPMASESRATRLWVERAFISVNVLLLLLLLWREDGGVDWDAFVGEMDI